MKLKYYLRGLGIGIVVTALIFMITSGKQEAISDAEIRERAALLGMVDASSMTLDHLVSNQTEKQEKTEQKGSEAVKESESLVPEKDIAAENKETESQISESQVPESSEAAKESTEASKMPESSETAKESTEASKVPESSEAAKEVTTETATIVVNRGTDSYTVCKDLKAAGLIEDAGKYDAYLCENGYSRSISVGTYKIPIGTSEEEIAKIITGKR